MENPESKDPIPHIDNPYGFSLHNVIWIGGAIVVVITLVVLTKMGVIH